MMHRIVVPLPGGGSVVLHKYSPDQARDDHGRFGEGSFATRSRQLGADEQLHHVVYQQHRDGAGARHWTLTGYTGQPSELHNVGTHGYYTDQSLPTALGPEAAQRIHAQHARSTESRGGDEPTVGEVPVHDLRQGGKMMDHLRAKPTFADRAHDILGPMGADLFDPLY